MSLTGAILGDIAGSRFEFENEIADWNSCELYNKNSVFTDDTVQSLAIGMAAITHKDYAKSLAEICNKYLFVGYGGNFHRWLLNPGTAQCNSWGNGSAMRVSAIGEIADSLSEAEEMAAASAKCTHNSYEGIKGAKAIAGCVYLAKKGSSKKEILKYAQALYPGEKYEYPPERKLCEYRETYKFEVSCQNSVPVAIRCFLESTDFESCLRNVFYVNGDTDTLGSMAGSIAGSYYGMGGLDVENILKYYLDDELFELWSTIITYISNH